MISFHQVYCSKSYVILSYCSQVLRSTQHYSRESCHINQSPLSLSLTDPWIFRKTVSFATSGRSKHRISHPRNNIVTIIVLFRFNLYMVYFQQQCGVINDYLWRSAKHTDTCIHKYKSIALLMH